MLARLKERLPLPLLRRIAPFWIACLIVGSLLPGEAKIAIGSSRLTEQHQAKRAAETGEWKHRAFHIVGFGATAFLFPSIARSATGELVSMIGIIGLGIGIEFAQVFVYANGLEPEDMRDDAYGVVGVYAAWLLARQLDRRKLKGRLPEGQQSVRRET